jgi:hypothetical protein
VTFQALRGTSGENVSTPEAASDAELLQAVGQGSERAFEELRRRYRRAIEQACRSIAGADLDCQRQLFLLGRVDRLLREAAHARGKLRRRVHRRQFLSLAAGLVVASLCSCSSGLPTGRGDVYLLWAADADAAPTSIGRFMVDPRGACRARFNLPGRQNWTRVWITPPDDPRTIVASSWE